MFLLVSESLKVWMWSVSLPVYHHGFLPYEIEDTIFCLQPCFYSFTQKQANVHPLSLFLSVYIPLTVSLVCAQAVRAEAGTMSTPTNPEVKELNPVDFIQLQQYIECEYRQAGRRAGSFSQRLTPPSPLSTSTSTHTYTLIYTRSCFSYLEEVTVCHSLFFANKAHTYSVFLRINLSCNDMMFQKCQHRFIFKNPHT